MSLQAVNPLLLKPSSSRSAAASTIFSSSRKIVKDPNSSRRRTVVPLLAAALLVFLLFSATTTCVMATEEEKTYYEILQVPQNADLKDIKKAYRRLALQTHPDRNPPEQKDTATQQFRQVNEAYEVLSDPEQRQLYDQDLRHGRSSFGGNPPHHRQQQQQYHNRAHNHRHRDPFAQFNDLFRNDPFFHEAFKEMDDLFAQTFQQQQQQGHGHGTGNRNTAQAQQQQQQQQPQQKKGWLHWLVTDVLGADLQITSSTTTPSGTSYSSTSYSNSNNNNRRNNQRHSTNTYTSKSTRTVIQNGQRVTIQSMEKDGNKIEEKFVNNQMVERLINGVQEPMGRIGHDYGDEM